MSGTNEAGVIRSSALMATGTIASRITGVVRDMAMVAAIGFTTLADTYSLGNSLPNIIYIMVAGGALNAVFIPQLVRHMEDDDDHGHAYANRLLAAVTIITGALTVVAVIAAPLIVHLYATDQYSAREYSLAIAFARLCLPQIVFYGLYTMFAQILNARGRFGTPMFAPIANNLVVIATCVGFLIVAGDTVGVYTITSQEVALLGIGTTLGVVIQAAVLIPVLRRSGFTFGWVPGFRGVGLGKTGHLAIWTIGLVVVNQVGFLVVTRLATLANVLADRAGVVAQGLTTYQKAYLIFMLPHSVITISIVTALLPRMSRAAADSDFGKVSAYVGDGMRLVSSLIIPAAAVLAVCGPAVTTFVFGYGAGSGDAAAYAGFVVIAFALGLLPFSLFYVLLRGWYSVEDTRTPFFLTVAYNLAMVAFSVPLFLAFPVRAKVVALAIGYSLAYWVVFGIAWPVLSRRLGGLDGRRTLTVVLRLLVAAAAAGAAAFAVQLAMLQLAQRSTGTDVAFGFIGYPGWALVSTAVTAAVLLCLYLAIAWVLRVGEIRQVADMVGGRLRRG